MLAAIVGPDYGYNMGNLKSYTMTLMLLLDLRCGREIYANYSLNFPYQPVTGFNHLIELMEEKGYNISIGIDEIQVYFDAYDRPNKKDGSKQLKNFARQTRKRGVKLWFTAQSFMDIHKSLRRITHKVYVTQKYDILPDGNIILCESDKCRGPHMLEITECKVFQEQLFPMREPLYLPVIPEIFHLYDTEELVGLY
jgi:hypothetical protein